MSSLRFCTILYRSIEMYHNHAYETEILQVWGEHQVRHVSAGCPNVEVISGLRHSATYVFRLYAGDVHGNSTGPGQEHTFHTRGTAMKGAPGGESFALCENALYARVLYSNNLGSTLGFALWGFSLVSLRAGRTN